MGDLPRFASFSFAKPKSIFRLEYFLLCVSWTCFLPIPANMLQKENVSCEQRQQGVCSALFFAAFASNKCVFRRQRQRCAAFIHFPGERFIKCWKYELFYSAKHTSDALTSSSHYGVLYMQSPAWKVVFRQAIPWGSLTLFLHLNFPLAF